MKNLKTTTLTLGLLLSLSSFATVRTVNNYIANSAQYSDVQSAITASAVGDTIYIHGSPTSYGDITIDKRLCLVGAGYNLSNTTNNFNTTIGRITVDTFNYTPVSGITGLTLQGIKFTDLITSQTDRASNVLIERCYINYLTIYGSNWVIKDNYIAGGAQRYSTISSGTYASSNIIIANNLIDNPFYLTTGTSITDYAQGVIIINNIIKGTGSGNIYNALIANNIIIGNMLSSSSSGGNTYNKNLTYTGTSTQLNLPPINNIGSGNLNNTNPSFINVPGNTFSFTLSIKDYNFSFANTSPCYNSGTDGTNLGITGGIYAVNGNVFDGRTRIPLMQELNINNSVLNQGQLLNVQFKARKNN